MSILVTYASKYGATQGIAARVAARLATEGLKVDLLPVTAVKDLDGYDAFVIGSAAYMGSWMKEAAQFVRRNHEALAARPVWLFSSGPIGTETKDSKGRDQLVASEPKEFAEFGSTLRPRGRKVFYGALDRNRLRGVDRLFSLVPASQKVLLEGDFRDWKAIESWAVGIAQELAVVQPVR